jgi:integration host factor subunit alpha
MATIKKSDFANHIRAKFGFTISAAERLVDMIFDEIAESLKRGEEVKISNFGTFKILSKAARMGRNPRTGRPAAISARRVPSFRASAEFRRKMHNS